MLDKVRRSTLLTLPTLSLHLLPFGPDGLERADQRTGSHRRGFDRRLFLCIDTLGRSITGRLVLGCLLSLRIVDLTDGRGGWLRRSGGTALLGHLLFRHRAARTRDFDQTLESVSVCVQS